LIHAEFLQNSVTISSVLSLLSDTIRISQEPLNRSTKHSKVCLILFSSLNAGMTIDNFMFWALANFCGTLGFNTFSVAAIRLFWVNKDMMLSIFEPQRLI